MKRKELRWSLSLLLLLTGLAAASALSLGTGEVPVRMGDLPRILADRECPEYGILAYIRIPRTLLGLATGGSLGLAGAILQGIYRNPLVEPYTLGISGGASLGVTFAITTGLHLVNILFLPLAGFAGAFATIFLVYALSLGRGGVSVNRMLLIGVMISFISSSLMMFFMSVTSAENIHGIVFWIMGSLNESNGAMIAAMIVLSLTGLGAAYLFATPLNALRLGEERAAHLGFDTNGVIRILFIITSLLTGACIAVAGVIGFVGLVIPHITRLWTGSDYRILLAASFLSGSIFLILCDVAARCVISPNELPVGVITGVAGGVTFILLLSEVRRKELQSKKL
ncbi:MAG: iron ABC transporter permease [Proteiniphilum sp.]|jgi:iron complex transport system permease protein|nr:iron ABC transporter permease [Proteiniphilum sp.]